MDEDPGSAGRANGSASAVLEEYKLVRAQIGERLQSTERALALAVAALAAVAGFGGLSEKNRALLLFPLGLTGTYLYGAQQLLEVMALAGYSRLLEERLNTAFDDPIWLWDQGLVKPVHTSVAGYASGGTYILIVTLAVWLTMATLWDNVFPPLLVAGAVAIATTITVTNLRINSVAKRAYVDAVDLYEKEVAKKTAS